MAKPYVSEFEIFMDDFMQAHPEQFRNKWIGWSSLWRPRTATALPVTDRPDPVSGDPYGRY